MRIYSFFFTLVLCASVSAQQVKLLFVGDVMGHGPQIKAAYDSSLDKYNYEPCFRFVKPYIQNADIAVANLEVVLGGEPYTGYPVFSSPDELGSELKNAGFDIIVNANNHCYDKGKYGFERTIQKLDSLEIPHLGTYLNSQYRDSLHPLIFERNDIKFAFLNYTYGTNGIVPENPNVVNYIDTIKIKEEINKAKLKGAECIIAVMHWGLEYQLVPNKEQKKLALLLSREGCQVIVGAHPHVVQTFEFIYPNPQDSSIVVPVFYSLGNFVSNQRNRYRDGGAMFTFNVVKADNKISIKDCSYIPYWVYKGMLDKRFQYYIIPLTLYEKDSTAFRMPAIDRDSLLRYSKDIKVQLPNLPVDTTILERTKN